MIDVVKGDLFSSTAVAWVNTVNTVGIMGKGVALEFKRRFPEMFRRYREECERRHIDVGQIWVYEPPARAGRFPKFIVCFPTKQHWRNPSRLEWIESGLRVLADWAIDEGIPSVAVPALGCGNGGLKWEDVLPVMHRELGKAPLTHWMIYEPQ